MGIVRLLAVVGLVAVAACASSAASDPDVFFEGDGGTASGGSSGGMSGSSSGPFGIDGGSSSSGGSASSGSSSGSTSGDITTVIAGVSDPAARSETLSLNAIAVDSSRVYVMNPEYVIAFSLDGASSGNGDVLLDCGSEQPCEVLSGLAVDEQNVYVASWGAGGIVIIPKAGGSPVTIYESSSRGDAVFSCPSCGMATNGALVCWISGCSTVACLPTTIGSSTPYEAFTSWDTPCLYGLGLDGSNAYTMVEGVVTSASLTTLSTQQLASAQQNPSSMAVDDTSVYWLIAPMNDATACMIQRVPKAGGTPTILLDCRSFSDPPVAIAVDSTYVWFATSQGAVKRMPKNP